MAQTWIVVADSARARIFSLNKKAGRLEEVQELIHPRSRLSDEELTTDKPGRSFDSAGQGRHAMGESVEPKEQEALKFSTELADALDRARSQNQFNQLVIIAAPAFLGVLRKKLSVPTTRLVAKAIDKELTRLDAADIHEHVRAELENV